jgi:two-component system response regulator PilR (NtrC family)
MNVLVVEDEPGTCAVLTKLLTRWGYDLAIAGSAESARTFLDNFRFDALLSDLRLPNGDGLQIVADAKRRQPRTLAVALGGQGDAADRDAGLRAGFDHYLAKPIDARSLRELLAAA